MERSFFLKTAELTEPLGFRRRINFALSHEWANFRVQTKYKVTHSKDKFMKKSILSMIVFVVTASTAYANFSGSEILANAISAPGADISVGDNSCALTIFHRQLLNSDLTPGPSRIEVRLWSYGQIIESAVSLESVALVDHNRVSFGKITVETDDAGTPIRASAKSGLFRTIKCDLK